MYLFLKNIKRYTIIIKKCFFSYIKSSKNVANYYSENLLSFHCQNSFKIPK